MKIKGRKKFFLTLLIMTSLSGCSLSEAYHDDNRNLEIRVIEKEESESYLVLVDQFNRLSADFVPNDLVLLNVFDFNNNPNTTVHMRETAAREAERMFQAAWDQEALQLLARSGYRSYNTQTQVHERFVNERGRAEAERISARPGHSEHQTGLALDVTANSVGGQLVEAFSDTPEGTWMKHNAHLYGFIISYPREREMETGFVYEPWHIRYVGVEAATTIYENKWILTDYLR